MFCLVKGYEALGLGKLIKSNGTSCHIEYFDSPVQISREVREVDSRNITKARLGANNRVYYQHEGTGQWLVGRVLQDLGDGVEIRFPGKIDVFLSYEQIFIRWKKPISDPVEYLANVITETPQYAETRSGFLASYISQRGAAWGISALLSSSIYLEAHQINVIRRILSDPCQRYLLADEVGLGKTIEAGVVIRQAVLDSPRSHRVIVLVPRSLIQQWRQELILRFGLVDFIDISVLVVAQDSVDELDENLTDATMLVIDEAHHVASGNDEEASRLYEILRSHAQRIERVLLLSATPVLRNELGFLRMLHLLDPVVYSLDDEKGFRSKISHRQVLAEAVASLDPQNSLYLDSILEELLEILPLDERLHEVAEVLKEKLIGLPDENDPALVEAIRVLRAHLSETYRLHRRILRNRRKQVTGLTPNREGARQLPVVASQFERAESILESWRIGATAMADIGVDSDRFIAWAKFYWDVIGALLTDPNELRALCEDRINTINISETKTYDGEVSLLQELVDFVDPQQWVRDRLDCLTEELKSLLSGKAQIVVFCSHRSTADAVFERLHFTFNDAVVRHEIIEDNEADDMPLWMRFNLGLDVRVLVCDHRAEEGINLQGGRKVVIHFDLPLDPNRIEQRMGRIDRYGTGFPVQSLVMMDSGAKYQYGWFSVLDSALGVFDRSISSLQYLVEDEVRQLRESVFWEGVEAFETLVNRLGGADGAVANELKLIDQQDGLDELSPLVDSDMDNIFEVDFEWQDIKKSLMSWVVDTLLFGAVGDQDAPLERPVDTPFRLEYRVPGKGGQATLVALSGFLPDFLGALDYEDPRSTSEHPLSYLHCAKRQTGVKSGTRLLRYGDEFIEAIKSFSELDDRGRSYALWRQVFEGPSEADVKMYFRFDFLIEARLDEAEIILDNSLITLTNTGISAIKRRGDALFPPFVMQIWLDEEGDEVPTGLIDEYLTMSYDKNGNNGAYIDTNLKPSRFRTLMELAPEKFSNWEERCVRMRDRAKAILAARATLAEVKLSAISRGRIDDEARTAQLTTRIQMLQGIEAKREAEQLELENKLNDAFYQGIESPSIKIDVAGVVILSGIACPVVQ